MTVILLSKKLVNSKNEGEPISIEVIPNNTDKYMAFYLGKHVSFLDSFQFISSSLAKLAGNLPNDKFIYTKEYFPDENQFRLMRAKGVYPYDYMDSISKFGEQNYQREKIFLVY